MKLLRFLGEKKVHKRVLFPSIINQHVCVTGREGPACGCSMDRFINFATVFNGKKDDVTCKKCRSLVKKQAKSKK